MNTVSIWLLFVIMLIAVFFITIILAIPSSEHKGGIDKDGVEWYYWHGIKCRRSIDLIVDHMPDEEDMKSGITYTQILGPYHSQEKR